MRLKVLSLTEGSIFIATNANDTLCGYAVKTQDGELFYREWIYDLDRNEGYASNWEKLKGDLKIEGTIIHISTDNANILLEKN